MIDRKQNISKEYFNSSTGEDKIKFICDSGLSQTRSNFAKIYFLILSASSTVSSKFLFLFSETTFIFLYNRLPNSSGNRRSRIHMQTWQFPVSTAVFKHARSFLVASAFRFSIYCEN